MIQRRHLSAEQKAIILRSCLIIMFP